MCKNPKWDTKSTWFTTVCKLTLSQQTSTCSFCCNDKHKIQNASQSRIFIYPMCSTGCSKEQKSTALEKHWVCLYYIPGYVFIPKHSFSLEFRRFPLFIYLPLIYFSGYLTSLLKLSKLSLLLHSCSSFPAIWLLWFIPAISWCSAQFRDVWSFTIFKGRRISMLLIFFDVVDLDVPTNTTYFCLNQCYFFLSVKQFVQEVGRRKWASTYI